MSAEVCLEKRGYILNVGLLHDKAAKGRMAELDFFSAAMIQLSIKDKQYVEIFPVHHRQGTFIIFIPGDRENT